MTSKVIAVVGARPQFIKAAGLNTALRSRETRRKPQVIWVHTGQHYDYRLSKIFFQEFSLPAPAYHLGVGSGPHAAQTGLMMERLEKIFLRENPRLVVVFGDTNSTLAAAVASAKLQIPVAHVEAGLRSFNRALPEEANRILTDHVSRLLFCPTQTAVQQLKKEGIKKGVYFVGDVMADLLMNVVKEPRRVAAGRSRRGYYLATIHRNINTDDPEILYKIFKALSSLDKPVLLPMHPRTKRLIWQDRRILGLVKNTKTLKILPPVSYFKMLSLEQNAQGVVTDSGGVQKEAFLLNIPCVTLRDETEWPETVQYGRNRLCRPDAKKILEAFQVIKKRQLKKAPAVFGSGNAAEKTLRIIEDFLK